MGLIRRRVSRVANFTSVFADVRSSDCSIDWDESEIYVGRTPHVSARVALALARKITSRMGGLTTVHN